MCGWNGTLRGRPDQRRHSESGPRTAIWWRSASDQHLGRRARSPGQSEQPGDRGCFRCAAVPWLAPESVVYRWCAWRSVRGGAAGLARSVPFNVAVDLVGVAEPGYGPGRGDRAGSPRDLSRPRRRHRPHRHRPRRLRKRHLRRHHDRLPRRGAPLGSSETVAGRDQSVQPLPGVPAAVRRRAVGIEDERLGLGPAGEPAPDADAADRGVELLGLATGRAGWRW